MLYIAKRIVHSAFSICFLLSHKLPLFDEICVTRFLYSNSETI